MKTMVIFLLMAACAAPADAAFLSVGGRAGFAEYSGDVLYRSGDVGGDLLLGAQAQISIVPRISFEAAAEYFATSFDYSVEFQDLTLSREVDFRDVAVYATVKLALVALPFVPLHLYAGGGPDVHVLTTDVVRQRFDGAELPDEEVLEKAARGGYHIVAGADLGGALLPLGIFAEARYSKLASDPEISSRSVYGGFRFGF